ncbi:MAG TPA: DUF501 domain-containing protein [Microthrixaceae bacterium]|nr:DUF501 domain-containing protein [Microthrixaceae bacterium]
MIDGVPVVVTDEAVVVVTDDAAYVEACLGRRPQSRWAVAARDDIGRPTVIRNEPFLDDGTPMPTRYWLIDPALSRRIGTLESDGGVRRAEAEVDPRELAAAHSAYATERDAAIPVTRRGPRPSGGVGGTARGVKCLHTHYAYFLAGGDDPVGRWVHEQLAGPSDGVAREVSGGATAGEGRPS